MDCIEARSLIDQGIAPGPRSSLNAQLGFHLAGCPACRAYRQQQQDLLASLLWHDEPAPLPTAQPVPSLALPPPVHAETTISSPALSLSRWFWIASLILLIGLPLGGALWVAGVLIRADQNIAAMVVSPAPTVAPSPTLGIPAATQGQAQASALLAMLNIPSATPAPTVSPAATHSASPAIAATVPSPWPTIQPPLPSIPPAPPTPVPPPAGDAVNILLLGNDRRPGEVDTPRTDSLLIVRVDPQRQRIALLSLPRDLWVEIPNYGYSRINAAYVWGEVYRAPNGGFGLARETVSNALGIPIDYVAMVDFQGFIGLIDSLGGIAVDVDKELYDERFPTMDYGYTVVHFLPGLQRMDGITALTYSRIRHPDSDFMRIRRQQAVLMGIGARLRERGDLENLLTVDQITGALVGFVQTDMPKERIIGLIWAFRGFETANVERYWVGTDMVSFGIGDDRYAMLPDAASMAQLGRQLMGTP